MAKFGEGDPRWRVQDMGAAGTNVNGWHWVERDAIPWSKARLAQLFAGAQPMGDDANDDIQFTIIGVDSVTGEAVINNRKQKIIPSYELEVKLAWTGSVCGESASGKIVFPYLADENHDETPELRFAVSSNDSASEKLKHAFLNGPGKQAVLQSIDTFIRELRAGGPMAPGAAPTPGADAAPGPATAAPAPVSSTSATEGSAPRPKLTSADPAEVVKRAPAKPTPSSKSRRELTIKEQFYCSARDLWECFTAEARIKAYTQSAASADARVGGTFSWFGGSVEGTFTSMEPHTKLAMDWRFKSWADDCTSKVTLTFEEPEPGHTFLTLHQTGIPEEDRFGSEEVYDVTERGWRVQIFLRIRQVFGFGLGL